MVEIKMTYREHRTNVEATFKQIYDHAVRMAKALDIDVVVPRIAKKMNYRANAPSESPEEHYRVNMCIPFLDHIINELDARFDGKLIKILE